jgi:hypothetical protein
MLVDAGFDVVGFANVNHPTVRGTKNVDPWLGGD